MSLRFFKASDALFDYPPQHGDHWGPWRYDARRLILGHRDMPSYEIDLEALNSSARMLDIIFQVKSKTWCSGADAGHLLEALRWLLNPQGNLCSFGYENGGFSTTRFLRAKSGKQLPDIYTTEY